MQSPSRVKKRARSPSENDDCPVCLDPLLNRLPLLVFPCNHRCHAKCVSDYSRRNDIKTPECFVCREEPSEFFAAWLRSFQAVENYHAMQHPVVQNGTFTFHTRQLMGRRLIRPPGDDRHLRRRITPIVLAREETQRLPTTHSAASAPAVPHAADFIIECCNRDPDDTVFPRFPRDRDPEDPRMISCMNRQTGEQSYKCGKGSCGVELVLGERYFRGIPMRRPTCAIHGVCTVHINLKTGERRWVCASQPDMSDMPVKLNCDGAIYCQLVDSRRIDWIPEHPRHAELDAVNDDIDGDSLLAMLGL